MKTTLNYCKWLMLALASLLFSVQAQALMLGPGDATATTSVNSNLGTLSAINSAFGTSYADLMLLWKGETGGGEEGPLSGSYEWDYSNVPENAGSIDHVDAQPAASCPTCLLIVKDGRSEEAQYLFDLDGWDGVEQIALSGFWPDKEGAISNVAIWGGEATDVSEPGLLILMGLGLMGLVYGRKQKLV